MTAHPDLRSHFVCPLQAQEVVSCAQDESKVDNFRRGHKEQVDKRAVAQYILAKVCFLSTEISLACCAPSICVHSIATQYRQES